MPPKKSLPGINDKAMINFLKKKLLQWTCERHATNQPLNREILEEKAIDLTVELGLSGRWTKNQFFGLSFVRTYRKT